MALLPSRLVIFSRILERTGAITSALELGCSSGVNLQALQLLLPKIELTGVEVNEESARVARAITGAKIYHGSLLDFTKHNWEFDLTFVSGVLIHTSPGLLPMAYDALVRASRKYVLVAEYYNPEPVEVPYRGDLLWKRDFAGELMDEWDLHLVDYGFVYRRDTAFEGNDITWFLLQK
jgi:pseudaminic acid biosynthesis-associated methylase